MWAFAFFVELATGSVVLRFGVIKREMMEHLVDDPLLPLRFAVKTLGCVMSTAFFCVGPGTGEKHLIKVTNDKECRICREFLHPNLPLLSISLDLRS